jgi:hypothetical protein
VDFELRSIPTHTWDSSTAARLLSPFAWVHHVHQASLESMDLEIFWCSAWTMDPACIPACKELWIVEPPSATDEAPPGKMILIYNIGIYFSFRPSTQSAPAHSDRSDMQEDDSNGPPRRRRRGRSGTRPHSLSPTSRGGGGSEPQSGGEPRRRPVHERLGPASIGDQYVDQDPCPSSQGSIEVVRMFPRKGCLGVAASLPVGPRVQPATVPDAILQQDSGVWVPNGSVNKHVRCLEDDSLKEERTPVAGRGRGLENGQCQEVCQVSMTSPSLHCFNYPNLDVPLPSIEASADDDGLPPFENGSPLWADGAGPGTIVPMEEATEFLSVEEGGWAAQTPAAGDLAREAGPSQTFRVTGPQNVPGPNLRAPASPLNQHPSPAARSPPATTKCRRVDARRHRGQIQQVIVSALASPAPASQAAISPVRNRTLTLIAREDDTRSWENFLVYFSHSTTMSCPPRGWRYVLIGC